jgi:hypothetical protein
VVAITDNLKEMTRAAIERLSQFAIEAMISTLQKRAADLIKVFCEIPCLKYPESEVCRMFEKS